MFGAHCAFGVGGHVVVREDLPRINAQVGVHLRHDIHPCRWPFTAFRGYLICLVLTVTHSRRNSSISLTRMLIILLLFACIRTLYGSPLYPLNGDLVLEPRAIQLHFSERSVNDIVISCVATIFACTWSAVHPNVQAPTDCWWTQFKRQVVTMICALLAPESITVWALMQRLAARKIMDEYNKEIATVQENMDLHWTDCFLRTVRRIFQDCPPPPILKKGDVPRWTLTHGIFLQMGGFVLCEDGRSTQVLTSWNPSEEVNIIWNIQKGIIDAPTIPEGDIQDRSKGDAISKTLIILQTTWFIAQCITRWSTRLPVTELEVITLGFAVLNGVTYALWWNKPLNVGRPVYLPRKSKIHGEKARSEANHNVLNLEPDTFFEDQMSRHEIQPSRSPRDFRSAGLSSKHPESEKQGDITVEETPVDCGKKCWLRRNLRKDIKLPPGSSIPWQPLIPIRFAIAFVRPLAKLAEFCETETIRQGDIRVPMFFSGYAGHSDLIFIPTAVAVGVLFGSIHLISSWFIQFSSIREEWLWRASAAIVTIGPLVLGFRRCLLRTNWGNILRTFTNLGVPFYIASRMILIIHSLISLHRLTPGALQTVEWTTFIPHL